MYAIGHVARCCLAKGNRASGEREAGTGTWDLGFGTRPLERWDSHG